MTLAETIAQARRLNLDVLDAQLLLLHAMGRESAERAWLLAHDDDELPLSTGESFRDFCLRRLAGEPLAYITGQKEFFGLKLAVDRRVLIPRPDTETLVEWGLELLRGRPAAQVLDLGTGSGAIALALKHQRADLQVTALDLSLDSLALAMANASCLALDVKFEQGHWFRTLQGSYDLILSNPPYVRNDDPHLERLRHEPRLALAAGADGLGAIREIISGCRAHLRAGCWLLLEHGYDQAKQVRSLLVSNGLDRVSSRLDLAGIERCSGGRCPG